MNWPAVGMGCWQLAGATRFGGRVTGWGELDDHAAAQLLALALAQGTRFFDTADAYGHGRSEERLGRALAGRDEVIVVSKFGQREQDGKGYTDFSAAWLQRALEGSLRRLRRERIEVLLLHSPPDEMDFAGYDQQPLQRLQAQGKIAAYGISARTRHGARRAIEAGFGSVVELVYNALDRRAAEVFPAALARGMRLIARCPLASGFLVPRPPLTHGADDHRAALPVEQAQWLREQSDKLGWLDQLPGGRAVSAVRFAQCGAPVVTVIAGVRTATQVSELRQAEQLGPLPVADRERIMRDVPTAFPGWA